MILHCDPGAGKNEDPPSSKQNVAGSNPAGRAILLKKIAISFDPGHARDSGPVAPDRLSFLLAFDLQGRKASREEKGFEGSSGSDLPDGCREHHLGSAEDRTIFSPILIYVSHRHVSRAKEHSCTSRPFLLEFRSFHAGGRKHRAIFEVDSILARE